MIDCAAQYLVDKLECKSVLSVGCIMGYHILFSNLLATSVVESKNENFPKDAIIFGEFGWRTYTVFNPSRNDAMVGPYILPDFGKHPISLGLGVFGLTGYN